MKIAVLFPQFAWQGDNFLGFVSTIIKNGDPENPDRRQFLSAVTVLRLHENRTS
jgi:hypothetical protein